MIAISTDNETGPAYDQAAAVPAPGSVPNQLLFREVNEQLVRGRVPEGTATETVSLLCECQRRSCAKELRLSRTAYEAVRRFPTRFVLDPAHVRAVDERVVDTGSDHVVVEKVGDSAQLAIRLDPRKRRPLTRASA